MKVVVTIATLNPQHGGPARTVPALCRALVRHGADLEMVTIAERGRAPASLETAGFNATVIETRATRYQPRSWTAQFKDALSRALREKEYSVLFDVGLWLPSNHFAAQIAAQTQTSFVISPRGMLSPQALQFAKWKKRLAWIAYQKSDLKRARVLHATSENEAKDFRQRGLTQPIAIVPNGVEAPVQLSLRPTSHESPRTLLFLSRLHPMKGLKDLVRAWAQVRPPRWRVVLAGPDEGDHRSEVESLVASLNLQSDFEFAGPVDDETKWKLLARTDLFVLPSYSESFGLAIAEALAAAVPVITTRATPWRELESHHCGWWIDTGVDALANSLAEATNKTAEELRAMGKHGRKLVLEKYSWDVVAQKMLSLFEWLIGRGEQPPWLI
jgi:glycosyltransferase involved in cell wall biosynthesis